ncbi:MAG: insulinase family protein [Desulfovibrio sp.]|nr:insulinase family protein [Desulfovibrio sp.]
MDNPAFTLAAECECAEVNGAVRLWKHQATGAQVLSIVNKDENKCFGVAFRTPPTDSTGVAHIIEHSVLCGSEKYPVKEPFVNLLKGSLQTFLNAFTFPDKTCYPVASANLQDFYNLIDVYLDAVFHPRISENSFRQEGWHVEADTPDGAWSYKGVVYNEMKGVYSSPDSCLAEESQHAMFPDTLYSLDSGGRPSEIPSLTYEAYREFHASYYHPSNARFFFWGDDPEERRLEIVAEELKGYAFRDVDSAIPLQKPFAGPLRREVPYAVQPGQADAKCLFTVNWLCGERGDVELSLVLEMLGTLLEGMPGSPLRRALISSGLGEDTTGSGLESDLRQLYYSTGLKGVKAEDIPAAEKLIFDTLRRLCDEGIDPAAVEAAVNSTEFAYRESNFGNFPRGLAYMLQALSTWLYDGDPLTALRWEKPLASIKRRLASGEKVFENALRTWFLDNPSRATVVLHPDEEMAKRLADDEAARVNAVQAKAGPEERQQMCEITRLLKEEQDRPDSPEAAATIPNLKPDDMPRENRITPLEARLEGPVHFIRHDLPTSGIAYNCLLLPLPPLPERLAAIVPLFNSVFRGTGTARRDYTQLGDLIAAKTGGLGCGSTLLTDAQGRCRYYLNLSGKALYGKVQDWFDILEEMLFEPATDQDMLAKRVNEILLEAKTHMEQGLLVSGNAEVRQRILARFTVDAAIGEASSGVEALRRCRAALADYPAAREQIFKDLADLREAALAGAGAYVDCIAEGAAFEPVFERAKALLAKLPAGEPHLGEQALAKLPPVQGEAFVTPGQVNYVGKGCNLYELGYAYSGTSHVIMRHLRMGYLWDAVRVKGGAYGASCSLSRATGNFCCTSYRDPNVLETLKAYDGIAGYLASCDLSRDELDRAIVGAVGDLDLYLLPDARGARALSDYVGGFTAEDRQRLREEILGTTLADFRRFADVMQEAARKGIVSVIGGAKATEAAERQGWNVEKLFA